jgi:hypothetical protein
MAGGKRPFQHPNGLENHMQKRHLFIIIGIILLFASCGGQPTTAEPSELDRVAGLLAGYEVEERPLSFAPEAIQAKAGWHATTSDGAIDIYIFHLEAGGDFTTAVSLLAEQGIDIAAEAPLSFAGTNGAVLFVVRNVAPPAQQEATRWMVSEMAGVLAGEE